MEKPPSRWLFYYWNYAIFTTAKQHRPGVNQAECLACHKPLDKTGYLFTLKQLAGAGKP